MSLQDGKSHESRTEAIVDGQALNKAVGEIIDVNVITRRITIAKNDERRFRKSVPNPLINYPYLMAGVGAVNVAEAKNNG